MAAGHYSTDQENFWAGNFGDEYSKRNVGEPWVATNTVLFAKILARTVGVRSVIEFGANIGLNLRALSQIVPRADLAAIEINASAAAELRAWGGCEVYESSVIDFRAPRTYDLALVKGVLIHIDPDHLPSVYDGVMAASNRYVCLSEYYSPTPVSVPYRGHDDRLFKRDFAGEMLDRFPELRLVDYGFSYHRDPNFPQDDTTWFLLEKLP